MVAATLACRKCGSEKPLDEFYPRNRVCKVCTRARVSAYYETNREAIIARECARGKAKRAAKPQRVLLTAEERAARKKARTRRWRESNRERVLAMKKRSYWRHKAEIAERRRATRDARANRARVAAWREANPERVRAQHRETQARRRARLCGGVVEAVDPQVVWERDEGICGICHTPADRGDWHLDHVIPISRGGAHTYDNVQVSHPRCNIEKGASVCT